MFSKYLISVPSVRIAESEAAKTGLQPSQWLYVPFWGGSNHGIRTQLLGIRVESERQLIGSFSQEENDSLLRGLKLEAIVGTTDVVYISKDTFTAALDIAHKRCLHPTRWRYIPRDETARRARLSGVKVKSEKQLVGWFTEKEKKELLNAE